MQATVLSFYRLSQWLKTNNCPDVLPFLPVVVSTTTEVPSAFAFNVPMSSIYGDEPSKTDFVQIVVSQRIPSLQQSQTIIEATNIPFIMIVTAHISTTERYEISERSTYPMLPTKEGEEEGPSIPKINNVKIENEDNNDGTDNNIFDSKFIPIICDLLRKRGKLLNEWVKLNDSHGNRGIEFLKDCDAFFMDIALRLANGDVIGPTEAWFKKLQRMVSNMETVSERFLRMDEVVAKPELVKNKKYRPVKTIDLSAPGMAVDIDAQPPQQLSVAATGGRQATQPETKLSESEMDDRLSELPDSLTKFILLALGVSGSAPHRGYRSLPVISDLYSSESRIDAYFKSVYPFIKMGIRELESDLSPFMLGRYGVVFRLGMILIYPNSLIFTMCARLAGLFMRKNLLYSVTRNGFTAHGKLEHQKEVNELLICLHKLIPNTADIVINWNTE